MSWSWRLRPISDFPRHETGWRDLNRRFGNSPLLDPWFIAPLLAEFGRGDELLAIGSRGEDPVAMTILQRAQRTAWQTFQPANNPLGALVVDPAALSDAADLAGSGLVSRLPGLALVLGLSQIDPDLLARPSDSPSAKSLDYIDTARISLTGSYEQFWAARGKNLRHNMNRQRNRLKRDRIETRLERLSAPGAMARAVADYGGLESSGWKAAAASAVHHDNAQGRFYRKMLESFASGGQAAVFRFFYGNQLVASDICLQRDGTLIILKTSYDETCKGTSPAHLMRHEVIRRAFEESEIRTVEFYGPVQDWHRKWTGEIRTLYHLNLYRWSLVSALHNRRGEASA